MQEKKWSWGKAATVLGVNKGLLWNIIHRKKKPPDKVLGRMLIAWEFDEWPILVILWCVWYAIESRSSDEFASFLDSLTQDDFDTILEHIPSAILEREPSDFAQYSGVS